jgi:hypothetical protein
VDKPNPPYILTPEYLKGFVDDSSTPPSKAPRPTARPATNATKTATTVSDVGA